MKNNTVNVLNVKNSSELPSFNPVEGTWFVNGSSDDRDYNEIIAGITAHFAAPFAVKVEIYHEDGRAITSDLPSGGTFLITRK